MKGKKVISILLSLVMTAVLIPLAAIPVLAKEEYTVYTIKGWFASGPPGAVASVKINGEELQQTDGSIVAEPNATVSVQITLNKGYALDTFMESDGYSIGLKGYDHHFLLSSSTSFDQIQMPDASAMNGDFGDHELYLSFKTRVSEINLSTEPIPCGTSVEVMEKSQNPRPPVFVAEDAPYTCDSLWVTLPEGGSVNLDDFSPLMESKTFKGGDTAYIIAFLGSKGAESYPVFDTVREQPINVEGGEVVAHKVYDYATAAVVLKMDVVCVPGKAKTESIVAPKCGKTGSHDEVVYCENCGAKISSETVIDPALGHDWGAWNVVKQPTATEKGLKQRVCKNDASHVQTMEIPATGKKKNSNPSNDDPSNNDPSNNIPKTGDENPLGLWIALLALSLLALSGYGFQRIRSAGKKNE